MRAGQRIHTAIALVRNGILTCMDFALLTGIRRRLNFDTILSADPVIPYNNTIECHMLSVLHCVLHMIYVYMSAAIFSNLHALAKISIMQRHAVTLNSGSMTTPSPDMYR